MKGVKDGRKDVFSVVQYMTPPAPRILLSPPFLHVIRHDYLWILTWGQMGHYLELDYYFFFAHGKAGYLFLHLGSQNIFVGNKVITIEI